MTEKTEILPENTFPPTYDEWEQLVFKNANHFTVFRFYGSLNRQVATYKTLDEAITDAGSDYKALIYAVTESGRAVCLPRKRWPFFQSL